MTVWRSRLVHIPPQGLCFTPRAKPRHWVRQQQLGRNEPTALSGRSTVFVARTARMSRSCTLLKLPAAFSRTTDVEKASSPVPVVVSCSSQPLGFLMR